MANEIKKPETPKTEAPKTEAPKAEQPKPAMPKGGNAKPTKPKSKVGGSSIIKSDPVREKIIKQGFGPDHKNDIEKLTKAGFSLGSGNGYRKSNPSHIPQRYNDIYFDDDNEEIVANIGGQNFSYKDIDTAIDRASYMSGKSPYEGSKLWDENTRQWRWPNENEAWDGHQYVDKSNLEASLTKRLNDLLSVRKSYGAFEPTVEHEIDEISQRLSELKKGNGNSEREQASELWGTDLTKPSENDWRKDREPLYTPEEWEEMNNNSEEKERKYVLRHMKEWMNEVDNGPIDEDLMMEAYRQADEENGFDDTMSEDEVWEAVASKYDELLEQKRK